MITLYSGLRPRCKPIKLTDVKGINSTICYEIMLFGLYTHLLPSKCRGGYQSAATDLKLKSLRLIDYAL